MSDLDKNIAVFGMGYVGCVTAACLSRDGFHVIGVDIDQEKVQTINSGCSPVLETGLEDLIREGIQKKQLQAISDVNQAVKSTSIALVAVGTPSNDDGSINFTAVERVVEQIGQALRSYDQEYTVVIRSTLLPGILEERIAPLLAEASGEPLGNRVHLCNNPEFLRETTAIRDYNTPPYVVIGAIEPFEAEPVLRLYDKIDAEKIVTDTRSASMLKYACNAFHALKVAFSNEIGALAKSFEADGTEVMRIACLDRQLNISPAYMRPGFAFGGSCLPKDVRALARFGQKEDVKVDLLHSILQSNEAHINRGLQAIYKADCRKIGLVGLSFKAGTDDFRESPLVILAENLVGKGYDLKIYDPGVHVSGLVGSNLSYVERHLPHLAALLVENPEELYGHSDLLVLGTDVANEIEWETQFTGEKIDMRSDLIKATPRASEVSV